MIVLIIPPASRIPLAQNRGSEMVLPENLVKSAPIPLQARVRKCCRVSGGNPSRYLRQVSQKSLHAWVNRHNMIESRIQNLWGRSQNLTRVLWGGPNRRL